MKTPQVLAKTPVLQTPQIINSGTKTPQSMKSLQQAMELKMTAEMKNDEDTKIKEEPMEKGGESDLFNFKEEEKKVEEETSKKNEEDSKMSDD